MKPLGACKRRLAEVLDERRRAALSLWMLTRVARAALACAQVGEVAVVGGDPVVARLCRALGAAWRPDPRGELNGALEGERAAAEAGGWGATLYLAADLPLLEAEDVAALAEASRGLSAEGWGRSEPPCSARSLGSSALGEDEEVPGRRSRHGSVRLVLAPGLRGGTNAILAPRGTAFRFQLGPASFARHREQAARLGVGWREVRRPGLELDVDLPEDLARLEGAVAELWRRVEEAAEFSLEGAAALVEGI